MRGFRPLALTFGLLLQGQGAVAQESMTCDGAPIVVNAPSDQLVRQSCEAAGRALALLRPCGLDLGNTISLAVVDTLSLGSDHCLGAYDCNADRIEVLAPGSLSETLGTGSAFAALDEDMIFQSVVAHEVTHAALTHTVRPAILPVEAQEYLAYAVQLSVLPETAVDAAFGPSPDGSALDHGSFNVMILMMAPDAYALRAYAHFQAPEHGCAFVEGLISGLYRFPQLGP